jgi:hypothetical protein
VMAGGTKDQAVIVLITGDRHPSRDGAVMGPLRKAFVCTLLAMFVVLTSAAADAATSKRHPANQRLAAAPRLIVCGMTGCFEVPPGCGHEMRRTGKGGVVAVILCDKR